jgi:hypothetical protein
LGNFGSSGGVDLAVPGYPNFSPFPAAANRTGGESHGPAFKLTETGVKILRTGVYDINISGAFLNEGASGTQLVLFMIHTPLGEFNPLTQTDLVGSSNSVGQGQEVQFTGFNRLKLRKGDSLLFAISCGTGAALTIVKLEAWQISIATFQQK